MRPRTHMLLRVEAEGEAWLADVGFGGEGLLQPLPWIVEQVTRQYAWAYRLVREEASWVLQSGRGADWLDLYVFTLEPQYLVDFEVANHYVATYPESIFVLNLLVQRPSPTARYVLRNQQFVVLDGGEPRMRMLTSDEEIDAVLAETFGLEVPHRESWLARFGDAEPR